MTDQLSPRAGRGYPGNGDPDRGDPERGNPDRGDPDRGDPDRGDQVEALAVDRYLDALIAAADRRAGDAPAEAGLDPAVRRAARHLRRDLVRVHPSFRFEERLATRLAAAATAMELRAAAGGAGAVVPFSRRGGSVQAGSIDAADLASDVIAGTRPTRPGFPGAGFPEAGFPEAGFLADLPDPAALLGGLPRPLLIGGALTSAAISLAGAYVAWRAWPGRWDGPMARAVRAVQHARAGAGDMAGGARTFLRASIATPGGVVRSATAHVAAASGAVLRRSLD